MSLDHRPPPPADKPDCPECARARTDPLHGIFDTTCLGCVARDIAGSPQAFAALSGRGAEPMLARIRQAWGPSRFDEGRRAVWQWIRARKPTADSV